MSKQSSAMFGALAVFAAGTGAYLWFQPQSTQGHTTLLDAQESTGSARANGEDEDQGTLPAPEPQAELGINRLAIDASTEKGMMSQSDSATQEPLSAVDRRSQHSIRLFKKALRQFKSKPGLASGSKLASKTAIAWGDYSGTSIPYAEGDARPSETLTAEEWSIWISDPFGSRLVRVFRDELPEFWEILALESISDRTPFDDSVQEDLLNRLEQRADTLLEIMGSQDS